MKNHKLFTINRHPSQNGEYEHLFIGVFIENLLITFSWQIDKSSSKWYGFRLHEFDCGEWFHWDLVKQFIGWVFKDQKMSESTFYQPLELIDMLEQLTYYEAVNYKLNLIKVMDQYRSLYDISYVESEGIGATTAQTIAMSEKQAIDITLKRFNKIFTGGKHKREFFTAVFKHDLLPVQSQKHLITI